MKPKTTKLRGKSPTKKFEQMSPITRQRGETSYIIEDMMNSVVAKKDHIMTGIGTDNMTCVLVYFKQQMQQKVITPF
jgi:hypothetical protein